MGKKAGADKAPVQQVIYVPAAAPTTETKEPTEEEKLKERAENVLKRSRSKLGTVLTGFQGVLGQNELVAPRKTLLGE